MPSFRIDFGAYFCIALGLLILPLDWIMGAMIAAASHEICHYTAATILKVQCYSVQLSTGGAVMEFAPMTRREECLTAWAGPFGSFLLCGFLHVYPQLAVCGLVQGLFNLLPIWPLDGGRILRCMLYKQEKLCSWIEWITVTGILCIGVYLSKIMGIGSIIFAGIVTIKTFLRKIPCKDAVLGVQ